MFLTFLDFDLEKPTNVGHLFFDNYQTLLTLNPETDEYKYLLFNLSFWNYRIYTFSQKVKQDRV